MAKGGGVTRASSSRSPRGLSGGLSFSNNSRQSIDELSRPYDDIMSRDWQTRMIFDDYTSGSSEINEVARFGRLLSKSYNSNNVDDWKEVIGELDKSIRKMPGLSRDVDLFRSSATLGSLPINGKSIAEINRLKGQSFTDKGYTSFSFSKKVAKDLNSSNDYIIVLKSKKGDNGVSLANTSSFNDFERQEEFFKPRNTSYRILGAKSIGGQKYLFVTT